MEAYLKDVYSRTSIYSMLLKQWNLGMCIAILDLILSVKYVSLVGPKVGWGGLRESPG